MITILLEKIKLLLLELKYNIEHIDSSVNYSTDEVEIGHWIDDSKLYRKTLYSDTVIGYNNDTVLDLNDSIPDNANIVNYDILYHLKYTIEETIYEFFLSNGSRLGGFIKYQDQDKQIIAKQSATTITDLDIHRTTINIYYIKNEED